MTAQPIAPVIPSHVRRAARAGGKAGPVRRLPLAAAAPEAPVLPDEVVYGFGRMDVSGRVGDRAIVGVLGWRPGDRLTLTGAAGVVIARRDPGGLVAMPAKPYLAIPAALRQRCGLRAGDRHLRRMPAPAEVYELDRETGARAAGLGPPGLFTRSRPVPGLHGL